MLRLVTVARPLLSLWIPVFLYACILFDLSSLHHPRIPRFWLSDKLFHALIYAGFGAVWVRAFEARKAGWSSLKVLLVAMIGTLAYGMTDEYHQLFVVGRSAEWMDLASDGAGGFLGGGIYLLANYVDRCRRKGKIQGDDQAVAPL